VQTTKFEFVINLQTPRRSAYRSDNLLALTDEVIE